MIDKYVHVALLEKIKQLRHNVWLKDIPSPECPEYIELHEKIQSILKEIDSILECFL